MTPGLKKWARYELPGVNNEVLEKPPIYARSPAQRTEVVQLWGAICDNLGVERCGASGNHPGASTKMSNDSVGEACKGEVKPSIASMLRPLYGTVESGATGQMGFPLKAYADNRQMGGGLGSFSSSLAVGDGSISATAAEAAARVTGRSQRGTTLEEVKIHFTGRVEPGEVCDAGGASSR